MAAFVNIANLAAAIIGEADRLRSADDDTNLSRNVKSVWDIARQEAIRGHTWNFALRRTSLASETLATPPIGWAYSFPLPSDCLRFVSLLQHGREDYQIEGGKILFDSPGPLLVRYLTDVVEPSYWDASFTPAFAAKIAFYIADPMTGDEGRRDRAQDAWKKAVGDAKRTDALETPRIEEEESGWELSRYGYVYDYGRPWMRRY